MFKSGFNLLISLIYGFLFMVFGILYIQLNHNTTRDSEKIIDSQGVCGNSSKSIGKGMEAIGKNLFINNCASCHAKDMKSGLTGPALNDFFWHWEKDTNEVAKYLKNTTEYLDTTTNKHLLMIDKKFGETISSSFPDLTYEEVRALIEYIEL